jgi:hypothetical protein
MLGPAEAPSKSASAALAEKETAISAVEIRDIVLIVMCLPIIYGAVIKRLFEKCVLYIIAKKTTLRQVLWTLPEPALWPRGI